MAQDAHTRDTPSAELAYGTTLCLPGDFFEFLDEII
jgi:hypothetical protein